MCENIAWPRSLLNFDYFTRALTCTAPIICVCNNRDLQVKLVTTEERTLFCIINANNRSTSRFLDLLLCLALLTLLLAIILFAATRSLGETIIASVRYCLLSWCIHLLKRHLTSWST